MRPECSEKKLEPANQPTYSRQQTSAAMGYQPAKERLRNRNSPRTAADMSVTVGKIKELARHFHGEGGALYSPRSCQARVTAGNPRLSETDGQARQNGPSTR